MFASCRWGFLNNSILFMSLHIEIKHKQTVKPKQTTKTYNAYYDRHIYTIEVSDSSAVIIKIR